MHQTRQGLSQCMAVISMLGTAKGDEENWAFRFQRLTNVCRPRRHYFGQNFLFHQLVSSWLLQSLYTVLLRTMPSAVHKQGILFGLGSLARPGQSAAVYAHQQQSYSAGDAVVEVELCVNVSSKFG